MPLLTRRALVAALALAPVTALAAHRRYEPARAGVAVDVSPLRRAGDTADADYFEAVLPGYIAEAVGPGRSVSARIDDVNYGAPGSNGQRDYGAVDSIQGVGWVDGRETPIFSALQASVRLPDPGFLGARYRQDQLARSFAQWLARHGGA